MSPAYVWLGAGLALLVGEVLAPGVFLMWLGLAALGTGAATLALGLGFAGQSVLFAALAAALCLACYRVARRRRRTSVNAQQSGLVGRRATALSFSAGEGRVRVGDSDWAARLVHGAAVPASGMALRVVGVAGTVLLVQPDDPRSE